MVDASRPVRVLYSFPHKIGAGRISHTAWNQVAQTAAAGAEMIVFPGVVHKPLPAGIRVWPTLARGRVRISYKALGRLRALALHDRIVASRLEKMAGEVDVVHVWPLAGLRTMDVAARLGIPTVLERPNAHTRYAYTVVREECERLGVSLPRTNEHAYREEVLAQEEEEYARADYLLCPSDFVVRSFRDAGVPQSKLLRHFYGYDPRVFYAGTQDDRERDRRPGMTVLFVGEAPVRKGLHLGLEAWLASPASAAGRFLIAGDPLRADYRERVAAMLDHQSVELLGYRTDVADLMRASDALVLPSLEEGSALVCSEALACGCVPLVSEAASAFCEHERNSLVHRPRDVETLTEHITMMDRDKELEARLRAGALATAPRATWEAAGVALLAAYRQACGVPVS